MCSLRLDYFYLIGGQKIYYSAKALTSLRSIEELPVQPVNSLVDPQTARRHQHKKHVKIFLWHPR